MRFLRFMTLLATSALSLIYLVGYARTVLLLHPVRPDPGILIALEPATVAYFDYASPGRHGLHCSPFFPPCVDLPLYSVELFSVPCWVLALVGGGVVFYTIRSFIRWRGRGGPNEITEANAGGPPWAWTRTRWPARIAQKL